MSFPAQDFYLLGGQKSPGKAEVFDLVVPHGWDERAGAYLTGATLVPKGNPLATWKIRHSFWDTNQFDSWADWASAWFEQDTVSTSTVAGNPGRVLSIQHPYLNASPWKQGPCVVLFVHGYEKTPAGLYTVVVDFKQWRKPIVVASKPSAAIPDTTAPQDTADDALKKKIKEKEASLADVKLRDAGTTP